MPIHGMVNVGPQISIKGEIVGDEDLVVEGRIEGAIDLKNHALHLGPMCNVNAEIHAGSVTIEGQVDGSIFCSERLEIRASGRATGNISSPRLALEDGGRFKGSIDMGTDADSQLAMPIQAPGLSQPKTAPPKR